MQSNHHIYTCPCAASSLVPGKGNRVKPRLACQTPGCSGQGSRGDLSSVSIKKDLERRTLLFVCFHDVVWICFSAPPGLTSGRQKSVVEDLH